MKKYFFTFLVILVGIVLCLIGGIGLFDGFVMREEADAYYSSALKHINMSKKSEVKETETKEEKESASVKDAMNDYIYINDTNIAYPLVQGSDNSFYLTHLPNGVENKYGSIFIDYQNKPEDFNVIIYGHNMKDGSMFGQLSNFYKIEDYAQEHSEMIVCWNGKEQKYKLFSVQKVTYDSEVYFINPVNKQKWIETQKKASLVNCGIEAETEAQFITLSTCGSIKTEKIVTIWKKY